MSEPEKRFFVLTGGPGSGKSSIIQELQRAGYRCAREAGRAIIHEQVAIGGRALPWQDPLLFAELMLSWDMRSYRAAEEAEGPVFFDRGVVDVAGYLRLAGLPVPEHVNRAVEHFLYNARVFIAPPWREIYTQDRERKQDFAEAVRTYEAVKMVYGDSGYQLVELPLMSVTERADFVLKTCAVTTTPFQP